MVAGGRSNGESPQASRRSYSGSYNLDAIAELAVARRAKIHNFVRFER